jgi:hypothetical protein
MPGKAQASRIEALNLDVERVPEAEARARIAMASESELTHYMAALGSINKDNPYKIKEGRFALSSEEGSRKDDRASSNYVLNNPDHAAKKAELATKFVVDGEISSLDWLRLKLSKTAWDHDSRYRTIVRNLIAIMVENDSEKIGLVNDFICQLDPYSMHTRQQSSKSGTTYGWIRGAVSGGDNTFFLEEYDDFTICNWTRLLCMADQNPEKIRLSEEAKQHIRDNLLVLEGDRYHGEIRNTKNSVLKKLADTGGFAVTEEGIQNSENHMLMENGSAYIKNQMKEPNVNPGSDLEIKLCQHLDNLYQHGMTEFNSIPYAGFSIDALLNLHDFAHEPVKSRATRVLDKIFYDYAIHATHDGRSFRPFSRLSKNGSKQDFSRNDHMRAFISTWIGLDPMYYLRDGQSTYCNYAFMGLHTSYRLPKVVHQLATSESDRYLAMTGQPHGNAEISYKNSYEYRVDDRTGATNTRQYLLSGGGLNDDSDKLLNTIGTTVFSMFASQSALDRAETTKRRLTSEIVSRNPVLILSGDEGTSKLEESFYLGSELAIQKQADDEPFGAGVDSRGKNNSGIYFDTMVGPYSVHVPKKYRDCGIKPTIMEGAAQSWTVYQIDSGLTVAVFDAFVEKQVGILLVIPGEGIDPVELVNTVAAENNVITEIGRHVKFPHMGDSVMKGKTMSFNPYSALDRYVFSGCDDMHWSVSDRSFYSRVVNKQTKERSPGWSAHSVIQRTPDESPVCVLDPTDDSYEFLNSQSASKHHGSLKR